MIHHLVGQNLLLVLVAVLKQFLNNVIAKNVGHQLQCVRLDLAEHLLFLVAVGSLQLLLDKARSVLVTTEFNYMAVDVLLCQSVIRVPHGWLTFNS